MKKLALVVLSVIVLSCGGNTPEKPNHLLSENEMENIIYDITVLQGMASVQPQVLNYNEIKPKEYIFKKYKIDSLTFAQNNTWYAADLEKYEKIQKKVSERIKKEREMFLQKTDTTKLKQSTPDASKARAKRDSLRKAVLDKAKSPGIQKK